MARANVLTWTLGLVAASLLSAAAFSADAKTEFVRSFAIDPVKYQGLWYEVARTPNDFEDDLPTIDGEKFGPCLDATANYALVAAKELRVHNVCAREAIQNPAREKSDGTLGIARIEQGSDNRKFKVAFGSKFTRFFQRLFTGGGADYWIYGVGQANEQGLYSWALVSGKKRDNLFILARAKNLSPSQMNEILELSRREQLPATNLIFTQR